MAHFAQLNKDNKVLQVIVISNDETHNVDGLEDEALGIAFCKSLFGADTKWVQTSYNASTRSKYAGIGDIYDAVKDEFETPPHDGEIAYLSEETQTTIE